LPSAPPAAPLRALRRAARTALTCLVLWLLALLPRLHAVLLGYVTPDEPSWVFRGLRFSQALEAQRWAETFQIGHPGVITMWLGALGIWWRRWWVPGTSMDLAWIDRVAWVTPDNSALFRRLAPFLPPARVAMAVLCSLGIVGAYLLARRLWGQRVALVGAITMALNPFLAALSGLLHVDAPATTFMLLSLLAWLVALKQETGGDLRAHAKTRFLGAALYGLLSGLCAGLAILSKSPSIYALAATGLSALLYALLVPGRSWSRLGRIALLGLIWAVGLAAALYSFPAMWSDPVGVLAGIYGLAGRHLDVPHRVGFYRGAAGDVIGPGFYPTVLLYRLTPATMAGLALAAWATLHALFGRPARGPTPGRRGLSQARPAKAGTTNEHAPARGPTLGRRGLRRARPAEAGTRNRRASVRRGRSGRYRDLAITRDLRAPAREDSAGPSVHSPTLGRRGLRRAQPAEAATTSGRALVGSDGLSRAASLLCLWAFAIGYTAFMTVAAKKIDRYLLPVFPVLDLLAAVGWVHALRWLATRRGSASGLHKPAYSALLAGLIAVQVVVALPAWPYLLDVYNPLAGGLSGALRTLAVGWGEGGERIAAYLNQHTPEETVLAASSPVTIAPLVGGRVVALDDASRLLADRVLVTALDWQIAPEETARFISGARLEQVVRVARQELLWLYDPR